MDALWALAFPPLMKRSNPLRFAHPLAVAGALAGLFYLQHPLNLDRHLRSPWPSLHAYWLPALAGLVYLALRLAVRVNLWTIDQAETSSPLAWEEAWTAANNAMARTNANRQTQPLYLALGETSAALEHLISAGYRPMPEQAPVGVPFRVWSREDSTLVCVGDKEHNTLASLAQLIARHTAPRLPFAGIVTLITLDRCATPEEAKSMAERLRSDIRTVTEAVGQDAPVLSVVLDAERLPNFETWAAVASENRDLWGIRFPTTSQSQGLEGALELANAVSVFCREDGPREIREAADYSADANAVRRNRDLFRLAGAMPRYAAPLSAFVRHLAWSDADEGSPILGLYLTGARTEPGMTAFFSAITDVLAQGRELAGWTYRTVEEDWNFRRLTRWALSGMGMAAAVLLAVGFWTMRRF